MATPATALTGVRGRADLAYLVLGWLAVTGCAVRFAFAGLAVFPIPAAAPDLSHLRINQAAGDLALVPQEILGPVTAVLVAVMTIAALIARPDRVSWVVPAATALVLLAVDGGLFDLDSTGGALAGAAVTGSLVWVTVAAHRRRKATAAS